MKYIKFTYVDAATGIPVTEAPAANGPKFPDVSGLEFTFARESQYPTNAPEFYGMCPDDAATDIPGVLAVVDFAYWQAVHDDEVAARAAIALERAKGARAAEVDALIVTTASGNTFDGDEASQDRMSRAITALDPGETTLWILADNTPTYITREELREALRLAGEAQTAIWVRPYQ